MLVQHDAFASEIALTLPFGWNREWGVRFSSYLGTHSVERTPLTAQQHQTPLYYEVDVKVVAKDFIHSFTSSSHVENIATASFTLGETTLKLVFGSNGS